MGWSTDYSIDMYEVRRILEYPYDVAKEEERLKEYLYWKDYMHHTYHHGEGDAEIFVEKWTQEFRSRLDNLDSKVAELDLAEH